MQTDGICLDNQVAVDRAYKAIELVASLLTAHRTRHESVRDMVKSLADGCQLSGGLAVDLVELETRIDQLQAAIELIVALPQSSEFAGDAVSIVGGVDRES